MKKIFMSMLALAALASCSSEEVLNEPVDNGQRVPINLKAGVVQVETKGAVKDLAAGLTNVVFVKSDHATAMDWANATKYPASIETDGTVTFTENTPYYSTDENTKSFLTAYYMDGKGTLTISDGKVTIADADFTGQEDIMFAKALSGTKTSVITDKVSFEHKLSQLKFTFKKGTGYDDTKTVKEITIKGTHKPTELDLKTGTLTYATTTSSLIVTDDSGAAVTQAGTEWSKTVLIEAVESSGTALSIKLDIELSDGTIIPDVTVNDISKPGISESHNVTLTFQQKNITATAEIAPWTPSSTNGTGTVE